MAYFCRQAEGFDIRESLKIVDAEIVDKYVVYVILIKSGRHSWTVRRRYSEFHKLHDGLGSILPHSAKLPPKRLVGNLSDSVISERKLLLENYLHTLLLHLEDIPKDLSNFLSFDRYEIEGVTKKASEQMFDLAEQMLSSNQPWQICPLLLHSVSSRRRLPAPKSFDKRSDMGHLMDFASQVKKVRILGGLTPIGKTLELDTVKGRISGVEVIKQSLESVICRRTISHLSDIFIADATNKSIWNKLTRSDLSYNGLTRIDESTSLLLSLQKLNLSHNRLTSIDNLHHLSALDELNLSHNQIADLPSDMRAKIGNVTVLNLATTGLRCLAPLAKLFSLKDLNVSDNLVARVDDVRPIAGLPCLEKLQLKRNPLTAELDYRFRLLELLSPREREVQVDGIFPTVQEIDTVAVRLAMTKAKIARQSSEINLVQKERGIPDGADASIPRNLPDVSNSNFVELLLTRIPNPIAGESLVSVIWTPIVLPTAPLDTLPAVIAVSTHSLHILRARGSPGPLCHVEHLLHIPLTKVSITYRHKVWVRFEDNGIPTSVAFRMIEDLITTVQAVNREYTNSDVNLHIRFVSYRDRRDFYLALANAEKTSNVYEMVDDKESDESEEEESNSDIEGNDIESAGKRQISPVGGFQFNSVDVNNTSNNTQKDYNESEEGATCPLQANEDTSVEENTMSSNLIVLDDDKDVESIEHSNSTSSEEFSIYDQYNN
ncbi:DgyrCDS4289 [Dimorphilus gyrociliatus]|uniref:DgyrCDS4289 n=1 Tax=Dimorphilus gyrociliatus TaxID=2664684 RepID=A0A7I8VH34_9ANNE|nr:DgyrCDS4289 [Dimorphilus gyrociliatus]